MSSIKTTQIDGDVSVGRNVAIGGKARVAGSATIGHNLKVEGWLEAPNIKDINNKGLFASSSALEAAYPTPRVGWWAMVGDSSPFAIYRCNSAGTWTATGGTASVSLTIDAETIAGWVSISSTSELPEDPTDDERGKGYLLGTVLYVYVGTGGDTLGGKYKSVDMKGPKGNPGTPLGETEIVDDLDSDAPDKVLSARQGKRLKEMIGMIDNLGTLDSESAGLADVTLTIKFSLTQNLTDVTSSVDADSVDLGDELTVTLTPASGYTFGTIRVLMGGVDITETAYSSNVVYIEEVTGDVSITAIGVEQGVVPMEFADSNVEAIILANFPHENEGFITEEEAMQITDIGTLFQGDTTITSFDELSKLGVTQLSAGAFYGCTSLASIDISNIDSIGKSSEGGGAGWNCFRGCSSLVKIKTNNTVPKIPNNCFRDCTNLKVLDCGTSASTFGSDFINNAMNGGTAESRNSIILRSSTMVTYSTAFRKDNTTLYVPDSLYDQYKVSDWATASYAYPPDTMNNKGRIMKPLSEYVEE